MATMISVMGLIVDRRMLVIYASGRKGSTVVLEWNDPFGHSGNDYDLALEYELADLGESFLLLPKWR